MRTETKTLHDDTLSSEARVAVKLYTHHTVTWYTTCDLFVYRQILEQRKLFRARLAQRDRIHGLEMRRVWEQRDLQALRAGCILQRGRGN